MNQNRQKFITKPDPNLFEVINSAQIRQLVWVAFFGNSKPTIIPLGLPGSQFEIYSQLEQNYSHTFLFESLTGPDELAETSIIGFDPQIIVQGFEDRITLQYKDGSTKTKIGRAHV